MEDWTLALNYICALANASIDRCDPLKRRINAPSRSHSSPFDGSERLSPNDFSLIQSQGVPLPAMDKSFQATRRELAGGSHPYASSDLENFDMSSSPGQLKGFQRAESASIGGDTMEEYICIDPIDKDCVKVEDEWVML